MPYAPDLAGCALDGRYELHEVIGEGAFGRVYRGRDRRLARTVAIKVIKPWWAEDPEWVGSFETEVQLLARVSDPGIVQIFDVGQADEGLYYVAEYVDGESLAARLRRGPLPIWDACEISEQLCRALAHAHAQRIMHRDVKPANVLISNTGRVKVGDFGVARLAGGTTEGSAVTIVGTPRYMAPEQARGLPPTAATDIYSVGVVLYEMIAGRAPFEGETAVGLALQHTTDAPPPLPKGTQRTVAKIVETALAKQPADRFASADEMADALMRARGKHSARRETGAAAAAAEATSSNGVRSSSSAPSRTRVRGSTPAAGRAGGLWADTTGSSGAGGRSRGEPSPTPNGRSRGIPLGESPASAGSRSTGSTSSRSASASGARRDAHPAGERAGRGGGTIPPTHVAPKLGPRHNVNPAGRRRTIAALVLAFALVLGMIAAAILLTGRGSVTVPQMGGMRTADIAAEAKRVGLHTTFVSRNSQLAKGVAIAQAPVAGKQVANGSTVQVVLSAGPPPVKVPSLVKQSIGDARSTLGSLGLAVHVTQVPAPGVQPGVVTNQSPSAGQYRAPHATVTLSVAETPQWRPLTTFSGQGPGQSVPFRIRGTQWRIVYRMDYIGTCTWIFFCSGPNAHVVALDGQADQVNFSLNQGQNQVRQFQSAPGLYQITVTPGGDTAGWSAEVDDDY
jgi:eukaryotic-like serine/threonine-protein kinase